jgi:cell division protein FtsL
VSASPATVPVPRAPAPARRRATPGTKSAARPKPRSARSWRPAVRPVRLVRRAPKRRRRTAPFLALSSLLLAALVVGIVTMQALVSQTAFRMQDLQVRAKALQQQYGERTLTVARLSAPNRIAAAAHRAGLVLPDPSHVDTLHVRGSSGALGHDQPRANEEPAGAGAPAGSSLKAVIGAEP